MFMIIDFNLTVYTLENKTKRIHCEEVLRDLPIVKHNEINENI